MGSAMDRGSPRSVTGAPVHHDGDDDPFAPKRAQPADETPDGRRRQRSQPAGTTAARRLSSPAQRASATAKIVPYQLSIAAYIENASAKRNGDADADQGKRDSVTKTSLKPFQVPNGSQSAPQVASGLFPAAAESRLAPQARPAPQSQQGADHAVPGHPVADFLSRVAPKGTGPRDGPGSSPSRDRRPPTSSRSGEQQHGGTHRARGSIRAARKRWFARRGLW